MQVMQGSWSIEISESSVAWCQGNHCNKYDIQLITFASHTGSADFFSMVKVQMTMY